MIPLDLIMNEQNVCLLYFIIFFPLQLNHLISYSQT